MSGARPRPAVRCAALAIAAALGVAGCGRSTLDPVREPRPTPLPRSLPPDPCRRIPFRRVWCWPASR